jgi:HEAT repeat protein
VRSAALARLTTLTGVAALDTILAAFADRDAALRGEAAGLAAGLGSPAVSRLREVALRWPDPAPETAVLALRLCEARQASQVLSELADEHPEARIRALAALAIGRPLGHAD